MATWAPWAVLVTGLLISAVLWSLLNAGQQRAAHTLLDFRLKAMVEALDASISSSTASLVRASGWWDELNGTPERAWRNDALSILHDYPAFTSIQLIDPDFHVRWDTAHPGNSGDRLDEPGHMAAARARSEGRPVVRLLPAAAREDARLDILVPVTDDAIFAGWMRGTLDLPALIDQLYTQLKMTSRLQIYHDGLLVEETGNPIAAGRKFGAALPVEFADLRLQAVLLPSVEFLKAADSDTPGMVLLVGVIATLMLTSLARQFVSLYAKDRVLTDTARALEVHRAHVETVYNAAPVGLCMFDTNMRYSHVNERMARIYGKLPSDMVGRTPQEVDPALGARFEPFMNYVLSMGMSLENVEVSQNAEEGTEPDTQEHGDRTWLCSFHPMQDAKGAVTGIVGAVLDISTLKEAETEKQELTSQLFLAQKTEALGRLTGGIAHDFNNMLGVILGGLEFIRDMVPENTAIKTSVDRIELAAEHSTDLIRRLLAFARQQPLSPRNVNVGATVDNLLPLFQKSLGSSIEIRSAVADDAWIARVDDSQLGSALLNLVINARDAMPVGGRITIEVENAVLDESYANGEIEVYPGEYVMVAVSDTGTGMAPDVLARAFEPFFTTKDQGRGSGLGLSMVFGFIKQSRGHIKIYSEVGHGTVIKLYLPRGVDHLPVASREERPAMIRGNEKVLVVEDDALMRDTTVRQLESLGYTVVQAANGKDALVILREQLDIALLLTDVVMPGGLNGPALAKVALESRPELKVLFVSGFTDNALIEHGWQITGVHLLQKPFRRADLAAKVHRVLVAPHVA